MPSYTEPAFEATINKACSPAVVTTSTGPATATNQSHFFSDDMIGFIQDSQPRRLERWGAVLVNRTRLTLLGRKVPMAAEGTLHCEVVA